MKALLDKVYEEGKRAGFEDGYQMGHGAALSNLGIHVTKEDALKAIKDKGLMLYDQQDVYNLINEIFKAKE